MKKNLFTLVLAVVAGSAMAQKIEMAPAERTAVYNLICRSDVPARLKVTLFDAQGREVLVDEVSGKHFIRPYNLSEIPYGQYVVQVSTGTETRKFDIQHAAVTPVQNIAVKAIDVNKYELLVIGNKAGQVRVNIYNPEKELVHSELISAKGSVSRIYNLQKLSGSNFTFEVLAADKVVGSVDVR
jgi:hypothetical protein